MFFRRYGFTTKIIALLLFCSIVPLIIVNTAWRQRSIGTLTERSVVESEVLMEQLGRNLGNYLNSVAVSAFSVTFDDQIKDILSMQQHVTEEAYEDNCEFLKQELNRMKYNNSVISRASILSGRYAVSSDPSGFDRGMIEEETWYQEFEASGKYVDVTAVYYGDYGKNTREASIAYLQKISHPITNTPVGICVIEIRYAKISALLQDTMQGNENLLFIADEHSLIYSPKGFMDVSETDPEDRELIYCARKSVDSCDYKYNEKDMILICRDVQFTGWMIIELVDKEMLYASINSIFHSFNNAIVILICVLVGVSIIILYRIMRPIKQIVEKTELVEQDCFDIRFTEVRRDEFGLIEAGFNKLVSHVEELLERIEKQEAEKREIVVKTLRAEINPHFLYNTLNVIRWRASIAGNQTVSDMIVSLIKTMEYNGKRKEEFVQIRDEIDSVRNYVQLLEYHYEDRFQVNYDIDASVLDYYICKMTIQPLVENAVFHGIEPQEEKGSILISINRQGESVLFIVKDDGVGMTEKQKQNFMQGIGVSNVNDRLCYYFGEQCAIQVESEYGKGTKVQFRQPVILSDPVDRSVLK